MSSVSGLWARAGAEELDRVRAQALALTADEVDVLVQTGHNVCADWSRVRLLSPAARAPESLARIRRCHFLGDVVLGDFSVAAVQLQDDISLPAGLYDSTFSGLCILSDGCRVSDTLVVHNVLVCESASVVGCGKVLCSGGGTWFGNGEVFSLGPENGGRDVVLHVGMRFAHICRLALGLAPPSSDVGDASTLPKSLATVVGPRAQLFRCDEIRNALIGPCCVVSSSTLDSCTLASTEGRPVEVSHGAQLRGCILHAGCKASHGCRADGAFLLEAASLGENARVVQSVVGPDSSVAGGECHHSLLGPFCGFHHHSLLIATLWPHGRGNLGYGCMNGSNHTGRVNDQECWLGEGCFIGLGAAVKFPANLLASPYTLVASATVVAPMRLALPFSLVLDAGEGGGAGGGSGLQVKPGWVLSASPYTLERAASKFASRRRARDHATGYALVRPALVDLVRAAKRRLLADLAGVELGVGVGTAEALSSDAAAAPAAPGAPATAATPATAPPTAPPTAAARTPAGLVSRASALAGVATYTAFLQRYALWGLLFLALHPAAGDGLDPEQQLASGDDVLGLLAQDLDELDALDDNSSAAVTAGAAFFVRSDRPSVLGHQLLVLREELGGGDPAAAAAAVVASRSGKPLAAYDMARLCGLLLRLETDYAAAVLASKSRDATRGRQIIDDYERVNAFCRAQSLDQGGDAVTRQANMRVDFVRQQLEHFSHAAAGAGQPE